MHVTCFSARSHTRLFGPCLLHHCLFLELKQCGLLCLDGSMRWLDAGAQGDYRSSALSTFRNGRYSYRVCPRCNYQNTAEVRADCCDRRLVEVLLETHAILEQRHELLEPDERERVRCSCTRPSFSRCVVHSMLCPPDIPCTALPARSFTRIVVVVLGTAMASGDRTDMGL